MPQGAGLRREIEGQGASLRYEIDTLRADVGEVRRGVPVFRTPLKERARRVDSQDMKGIMALVVALGLALIGCEEMTKGGAKPPLEQPNEFAATERPNQCPGGAECEGAPEVPVVGGGVGTEPTGTPTTAPDQVPTGSSTGTAAAPTAAGVCSALRSLPDDAPAAIGEPCGCEYDSDGSEVRLLVWTSLWKDSDGWTGHCGP